MCDYKEIAKILEREGIVRVRTWISQERKGEKEILELEEKADGEARKGFLAEKDCITETFITTPRLILLGSGYVAMELCKVASYLGFFVTVCDDRQELLTRERFEDAVELKCGEFSRLLEELPPYGNAYYGIMTRNHDYDQQCVREIIKLPFQYLGMIGSRRKAAYMQKALREEGFPKEKIRRLRSPIGLDIGAKTPREIAVSIGAELIACKNARDYVEIPEEIRNEILKGSKGVMATIIEKSGSAPREPGCRMLIGQDGICHGTIGGGKIEYLVIKDAETAEHMSIREYGMESGDMICGGRIKVLFEKL